MEILQTIILLLVLLLTLYVALKQTRSPRIKSTSLKSVLLDSSALIDGRILDVARIGFLGGTLVVPSSVLREMQYLADNADSEKRSRARHGLDVVKQLQDLPGSDVEILDDGLPGEGGVDERLVQLAKTSSADLLTLDFNLNKVAAAEGIRVLNINELAQTLRMSYLPGEKRHITLVNKGQDKTQAVGYLEDGTMVVVENAGSQIGQSVEVEFTRALQTAAGKMLFAKKLRSDKPQQQKPNNKPSKSVAKKPTQRQPRKRQTPEDSLVKLANQ
ncbi:hypothetical protein HY004_01520 [Candidatus Saccharibacteria bacterium]|nr:hypothetical protein [Candidatus Saccharibacteria bacterium]